MDFDYNKKYGEYIVPHLKEFWNKYRNIYLDSGYPNGVFLPHVYENYAQSPLKVFYIGQDVPYWINAEEMGRRFDDGMYSRYIETNNSVMNPVKQKIAWGNNNGAFWTMVVKLHLLIHTEKWFDLTKIPTNTYSVIQSLGYGNVNSLMSIRTLQNYYGLEEINTDLYWKLRNAVTQFEHLKTIIDIYEPDVIVIFCRDLNEAQEAVLFNGLEEKIHWSFSPELEEYIVTGEIFGSYKRSKLIWCPNPNYFRYLGTNMREMAELIVNNID